MANLGMLLLTYSALVAQTSLRDQLALHGVAPDFLALAVVVAAFGRKSVPAIAWASLAGLLADCLGSAQLGLQMLLATLLATFIQVCIGPEWRKSFAVQTVFGATIIFVLIAGSEVTRLLLSRQAVNGPKLWPPIAAIAVYSSAIGIILRMLWKTTLRVLPARTSHPRVQPSGRWDMLSR